jgi:hypothetical protein
MYADIEAKHGFLISNNKPRTEGDDSHRRQKWALQRLEPLAGDQKISALTD